MSMLEEEMTALRNVNHRMIITCVWFSGSKLQKYYVFHCFTSR